MKLGSLRVVDYINLRSLGFLAIYLEYYLSTGVGVLNNYNSYLISTIIIGKSGVAANFINKVFNRGIFLGLFLILFFKKVLSIGSSLAKFSKSIVFSFYYYYYYLSGSLYSINSINLFYRRN